jgi:hypothetical protein
MPTYIVEAKIDQIVTKEIKLLVEADSPDKAQSKARDALTTYPAEVTTEGVNKIVTTKSSYWVPKSIEFTKTKKET